MELDNHQDHVDATDQITQPKMNVIPGKTAEPYFDFKYYRDKISDLNALKCLDLYLERTHNYVTASPTKEAKENDAI